MISEILYHIIMKEENSKLEASYEKWHERLDAALRATLSQRASPKINQLFNAII